MILKLCKEYNAFALKTTSHVACWSFDNQSMQHGTP